MAVLNRNPLSRHAGTLARPPVVFLYELKRDLNLYLKDWATNTEIRNIADIVAFNEANAGKALRFGQDLFLAADITRGDLSEREYKSARAMDLLSAKTRGMDAYMNQHKLDAVLFAGSGGCVITAKAGYPSVMVPSRAVPGASTNFCVWPTPMNRPPPCASHHLTCSPFRLRFWRQTRSHRLKAKPPFPQQTLEIISLGMKASCRGPR
jgi:hypothetical protein